ncbi:hypothetical protein CANARDRAFT_23464 [[Candida] arabinofermentans NRRL YB-2248]|uniref:UDENN domain-containing protein n=1 Tax=[Candida] arabinofermentans NRRL YB-2248 TaxID=983967 RepID=A0A1E4SZJ5_9ASCO|nr:hypothetical protein CANARDRAFT_23464 [[Candida] arabinofermentans NRRL YB-2248]
MSGSRHVVDYLILSEFDKLKGLTIKKQMPSNIPLISNQLDYLIDLIMPLNLHKYLNKENYTMIPLFIHSQNGLISFTKESNRYEKCYLFTISYFKKDNSYRNGTAKCISLITRLPLFESFKPLMTYILHYSFDTDGHELIQNVFHNLNTLQLHDIVGQYKFDTASRFLLTRLEDCRVPLETGDRFTVSDGLLKTFVSVNGIKFPLQIPIMSLISSNLCQFGLNLTKGSSFQRILKRITSMEILNDNKVNSPITPYSNITPLQIIINAMLLNKKILVYCYDECYNEMIELIQLLILLVDEEYPYFPILDLGNLPMIEPLSFYLIGTSNLLFKTKLDWDMYIDLDTNQIFLNQNDLDIESELDEMDLLDHEDKRSSIISNAESKIRQLFKKNSSSISQPSGPTTSSSTTTDDSLNCMLTRLNELAMWDSKKYPKIDSVKTNSFFNSQRESNFFQIGFNYRPSSIDLPSLSDTTVPVIDQKLTTQVSQLLKTHQDDLSIYISITNYILELKSVVLSAFGYQSTHTKLKEYKKFVEMKLHEDEYMNSTNSLNIELKNYIRNQKCIQPLIIEYPYNSESVYILDDANFVGSYNSRIAGNGALGKFSTKYAKTIQSRNIPQQQHHHHHQQQQQMTPRSSHSTCLTTPILYDFNDVCLSLDYSYLVSEIDGLLDNKKTNDWRLGRVKLLQLYKTLNSLLKLSNLKDNGTVNGNSNGNINGNGSRNGSIKRTTGRGRDAFESLLCFMYLKETQKKSSSDGNNQLTVTSLNNFEKLLIVSSIYYNYSSTKGKPTKRDSFKNDGKDQSGYNGVELNGDRASDSNVTKKTKNNKEIEDDEVLLEFKKFLSLVLNNSFFKKFLMSGLNDFVKLNINDFIDYHM